jgi:thiol-disulfide isomerase/thioredoxin
VSAPNPKEELTLFRTTQIQAGYSLSERLRLNLWIPYRQITSPKTDFPNDPAAKRRFTRQFGGIGDVVAMASFMPIESKKPGAPSLMTAFGARLPTGSSQPDHDWGTGISRDPVLQTSAGTLDPIMGGTVTIPWPRTNLYANALVRLSGGQNVHGYRFATEYQAGLGVLRTLSERTEFSVAGYGIFTGHDRDRGKDVPNTGGSWLYLTPRLTLRSGLVDASLSVQLPVYQRVNASQLVSDYVFSLSLTCGFNLKRSTSGASGEGHAGRISGTRAGDIETVSLGEAVELADFMVKGKITVFEFYSDRCLACAALEPELRLLAGENPNLAVRKINIGSGSTPVVSRYEIRETPTLIVYDGEGQKLLRQTGIDLFVLRELISR